MPQQYKIDKVNDLKVYFESNKDYIFNNYSGLSVAQMTDMRRQLTKAKSKFVVCKNNFIKRILKEKGYPEVVDGLFGPTGVTFTNEDLSEVLKILFKFSDNFGLVVKGAFSGGSYFSTEELKKLSRLPGKKQLIALLMATMNAPAQNFVFACNDVITRFVRALNAVCETKK